MSDVAIDGTDSGKGLAQNIRKSLAL